MQRDRLYGLMAEFEHPEDVVAAAAHAREAGYRKMDAYTPMPVHGLDEALGLKPTKLPWVVLGGAIVGCVGGFSLLYWISVIAYPLNIGGKPLNSWPAFIPITFETTVLCAAFAAVLGMLAMNGLPTPYHPVFNAPRFKLATRNRFFLCIEARDPLFDREKTRAFLESQHARGVEEVEH
jgi:hypothetical protein